MSKPGGDPSSGISLEDVLRLTKRHPACERLGVKFPGPTRQNPNTPPEGSCQLPPATDIGYGREYLQSSSPCASLVGRVRRASASLLTSDVFIQEGDILTGQLELWVEFNFICFLCRTQILNP